MDQHFAFGFLCNCKLFFFYNCRLNSSRQINRQRNSANRSKMETITVNSYCWCYCHNSGTLLLSYPSTLAFVDHKRLPLLRARIYYCTTCVEYSSNYLLLRFISLSANSAANVPHTDISISV